MAALLRRPGFHTSEWAVAIFTAALNLANNAAGWVSWRDALLPTLAAVSYIVSRGLAKTETHTTSEPPA